MSELQAARVLDPEIDFIARAIIAQHGDGAARAAVDHLNAMIDQGDFHSRDMWARVVHAIHDHQRLCPEAARGVTSARELTQLAAMGC
ncbi:MAG TPA: hypothetical protein VGG57_13430 [Stellaceae bacterium]|jgi:hypothetical protein